MAKGTGNRVFRLWAAGWGSLTGALFAGVTALTLSVWAGNPAQPRTPPVADIGFFVLGASIAAGFLAQARNPQGQVAGVQQAFVASLALTAAGVFGQRIEPAVGGLLLLASTAVLAAGHPARALLFRLEHKRSLQVDGYLWLHGLWIAGLAPALLVASSLLRQAAASGPTCFLGQCAAGDRLAEMAATVAALPFLAMLGAIGSPGWQLPVWTAGLSAGLIGLASIALPQTPASLGTAGGAAAVLWGAAVLLSGRLFRKRRP